MALLIKGMMNKDNTNINLGLRAIGKTTLVTAVYFLANFLVFLLISNQNLVPLIWPQAGVALAAILLIGFDPLLPPVYRSVIP
jgi:steroid 5-alpha reductase family enzyme